ncbi:hypothetical protein SAMN05444007_1089 [Cribrihabitans marinus]|uniref:Uncharacterized protein n=1 Tax=Cribrihabitans marinus TaxID=1227549 RepID=A0A1H7CA54_9RHOB|nr:hypothetical protein [Cribrihabitans marinus]GGH34864.1 hypothetical protein GCM10010973_27800 [Cribrihabitans marinus]SEJ86316.1 hypothetical protein SAMN05444007_1089 [Cribrihabitans marinus]
MPVSRSRTAALLCALAGAAPLAAQSTAEVRFEAGSDTAAVNGAIIGDEYANYVLGANEGQTMSVALTVTESNGLGTAYFNILPPGSHGVAIYDGSMDDDGFAEVQLPESGDYTIRVYQMGNDADTGKTTRYAVSFTID